MLIPKEPALRAITLTKHDVSDRLKTRVAPRFEECIDLRPSVEAEHQAVLLEDAKCFRHRWLQPVCIDVVLNGAPLTVVVVHEIRRIFEYAMRWRYLDCQRNPMGLIELRGTSRRVRPIYLLTPKEYYVVLSHLAPHVRLMAVLAMNTGMRISEILGLQWGDVDFERRTLTIERSVVGKYEGETKTIASADVLPLHEVLVQELQAWKARENDVNGWLFGNIDTGRPYHADSLRQDHLAPAGRKAGIPNLGWHNFRHTYRSRLGDSGVAPEVQQKLMRHSSIDMTMKYGQNAMLNSTRPANARLVGELLAAGVDVPQLRPQDSHEIT